MSRERTNLLLKHLSRSCGLGHLELDENDTCMVVFDDVAVHFECWPEHRMLCLFSPLGEFAMAYSTEVKDLLLDANVLFAGTQGPTFGVPSGTRLVTLQWLLYPETLETVEFEERVAVFVDLAEEWVKKLEKMSDQTAPIEANNEPQEETIFYDPGSPHMPGPAGLPMPRDLPMPPRTLMI